VITKEPSPHLTPLPNEPAGIPQAGLTADAPPTPIPVHSLPWWLAWFDVLKAFLVWVLSVILLVFVPVLVALPYLIYTFVNQGAPRPETLMADKTLIFLSILGIVPTHLLTLGMLWLFVTEGGRRPFLKTLGFEWPASTGRGIATALSVLLALVLLGVGYLVTILYGGSKTQLDLLVESSMQARFATAFVAVATAPLVEELLYRGLLYSALERAAGMRVAVPVISLLFAGVHVFQYSNNVAVITVITLLSITLTVTRALSGSVLPPFIIHLVFNGIQSLILALGPFVEKYMLDKADKAVPTAMRVSTWLAGYVV
jgi:membrane protease YdiL (CAAX protease family)